MKKQLVIFSIPVIAWIVALFWTGGEKQQRLIVPQALRRPNIILIMADDMGFSDLGCYGGEIHTPHIDYLAQNGIRYTQFYNTSRCCSTRASLLTGLYNHQAGIGKMTDAEDAPGYQGHLTPNTVTLAVGYQSKKRQLQCAGGSRYGFYADVC